VNVSSTQPADVWALIDAEPVAEEDGPDFSGWLQRLCRATARALPASDAALSIGSPSSESVRLAASGERADFLEQLQFTLGEGPCHDVFSLGRPVLVPDLEVVPASRWPGYTPTLRDHGVMAVFAFPLRIGALMLGTLDVYRDDAGALDTLALARAIAFSGAAVTGLLDARAGLVDEPRDGREARDDLVNANVELYQAQGMVQVQLGVSLEEAMARLRAYAYVQDRPLDEVARDVVARRLRLEKDS
jgi:GAF domain/ANTAR domain